MKNSKIAYYSLGTALLLVFAGFSYSTFQDTLTAYVDYDVARSTSRSVQVAGGLVPASSSYDDGRLYFTLVDEEKGDQIPVRYEGTKPANFEEAISIVAIGQWDAGDEEFAADRLLVKCPSKYQGVENEEKSYG